MAACRLHRYYYCGFPKFSTEVQVQFSSSYYELFMNYCYRDMFY